MVVALVAEKEVPWTVSNKAGICITFDISGLGLKTYSCLIMKYSTYSEHFSFLESSS